MKPWQNVLIGGVVGVLAGLLLLRDADVHIARKQASAHQHRADSLQAVADSLSRIKSAHIVKADSAAQQVVKFIYLDQNEVTRYEHERANLDTAGALGLKRTITWTNEH